MCYCCCTKNQSPICLCIAGIASSIVTLGFLIWGVRRVLFWEKAFEALYTIACVLVGLSVLIFIVVTIFINLEIDQSKKFLYKIGKISCIVNMIISILAQVFVLIAFIKGFKDYIDIEKILKGRQISIESYLALFFPFIICLIGGSLIFSFSNALMKEFDKYINPKIIPDAQNTMANLNNLPQPGMSPNNNGPMPSMANTDYQTVVVKQNEKDVNNKWVKVVNDL